MERHRGARHPSPAGILIGAALLRLGGASILVSMVRHRQYAAALLTYLINVPLSSFVEGIIWPGWRNSTRWVTRAVVAFALLAIAVDVAAGRPFTAGPLNRILVLVLITTAAGHVYYGARTARTPTVLSDRIVTAP